MPQIIMNNARRLYFLTSVREDTLEREAQLSRLEEFLDEWAPESPIVQELSTQTRKIRFLQGLWNGTRRAEEIIPIQAETWYYKEGKYRISGSDRWMTRAEYFEMPLPQKVLLVRLMVYLSESVYVPKPEMADFVIWLSPHKHLFTFDGMSHIQYTRIDKSGEIDFFQRQSDQVVTSFSEVLAAERNARKNNEPFEVCYATDFVFPNW